MSRDPLGSGYRYAANNPVSVTDPSGLTDWYGDAWDLAHATGGDSGSAGGYAAPDPAQFATYEAYLMAYAGVQALNHGGGDSHYLKNTLNPVVAFLLQSSYLVIDAEGGREIAFDHNNRGAADFIGLLTGLKVFEGNSWHMKVEGPKCTSAHCEKPHGPGDCMNHGLECLERVEMFLIGTALEGLGVGLVVIGCETVVLCPAGIVGGGAAIGAGVVLQVVSLSRWH